MPRPGNTDDPEVQVDAAKRVARLLGLCEECGDDLPEKGDCPRCKTKEGDHG